MAVAFEIPPGFESLDEGCATGVPDVRETTRLACAEGEDFDLGELLVDDDELTAELIGADPELAPGPLDPHEDAQRITAEGGSAPLLRRYIALNPDL